MRRRPPRSTLDRSSAASDVYKRQAFGLAEDPCEEPLLEGPEEFELTEEGTVKEEEHVVNREDQHVVDHGKEQ